MRSLVIAAALLWTVHPVLAQERTLENPALAFGARQSVQSISLSPDGSQVVYVAPGAGEETRVYISNLVTGETHLATYADGDPLEVTGCEFVSEERLVCRLYALQEDAGYLYAVTRSIALNRDGSDIIPIGRRNSAYTLGLASADGEIIDWLPDEPNKVLAIRVYIPEGGRGATRLVERRRGLAVDAVDTVTGDIERVVAPRDGVNYFRSDGRGNVRILMSAERRGATGYLGESSNFFYRRRGSSEWEQLSSYNGLTRGGFLPVRIDPELDIVYGFARVDGRQALVSLSMDGRLTRRIVYAHDEVDVDGIVTIGPADRVIGVSFADDYRRSEYFDETYAELRRALAQALPNLPQIGFVDATLDESIILLRASSDVDPGRYFVFNRNDNTLNEIALARPELEGARLARVRPVRYPSSDGVSVPGYLTLPPGNEDSRGLPAIVMPHGGPSARDEWGFDWLAQYFAYQGYAVLQPNYRGSAGFGDEWFVENGFQSWELAIGDINAGGRWLIDQGIAHPDQLAIFGWSYGGYAALQSGVVDPDLFKAIVAVAPVTDLDLLRSQARLYSDGSNVREFIGEGSHIEAGSPARNASRITAPVLMFHGDQDLNVDIDQARRMHDRLEDAGRSSRLVVFEDLDHHLGDSLVRARMLRESDIFLRRATGRPIAGLPPIPGEVSRDGEGSTGETVRPNFPGAVNPGSADE